MMMMHEAGLVQHWYDEKVPKVEECFRSCKTKRQWTYEMMNEWMNQSVKGPQSLSLKGLCGLVILFI